MPVPIDRTTPTGATHLLDAFDVRFESSPDGENVDIVLVCVGRELRLPNREHSYMLLVLPRARQQAREAGVGGAGSVVEMRRG